MGRLVHGSVLTVVGQDSMPISTAIRSHRQNSSSWFRRRATASNVPSSKKALFRLVMVPPKNRVGDAVTRRFVPALAEVRMSNDSPRSIPSSKTGVFGTGGGRRFQLAGTFGNQPSDRQESDLRQLPWLLRARRERPRDCRAAEQRDELATFQLIELHSVPPARARLQDIELARIGQEVTERFTTAREHSDAATTSALTDTNGGAPWSTNH